MSGPPPGDISLDHILITEDLSRRPVRQPNWQAESEALRSLSRQLVHNPEVMLQSLVDWAVELCDGRPATAGVSLMETHSNGADIFRWVALSGTLAHQIGHYTPRNFSPCGVCLEQGAPVLFSHPERYFTYFQAANIPFVEGLVLPLLAAGQALGTIWIITHDEVGQFDPEDIRLMTGLADFAAAALLRHQQQTQALLTTNARLEVEVIEHQLAEARARALVENLPGGAVFIVDRDLRYQLAAGEALAIAHFSPEDFIGRTLFEVLSPALAASYEPIYRQALAGEPFEHEHQAHDRWYISRGIPLSDSGSEVYAVLVVSYDITDRKRAEAQLHQAAAVNAFRVKLSDALRSHANAVAIQEAITRIAMHHFGVDRCYYCEINNDEAIIRWDATRDGLPSVAGVYPLSRFAILKAVIEAGRPIVVPDVRTTDTVGAELRQLCLQLHVIAYINVPVIKNGKPVGALCLVQSTPRDWTELEVQLALETADRTWAAVERAQAEAALRESEQRLSAIFAQAAVGLSEISLDGRFQRVNQALCQLLGRSQESLLAASVPDVTHPDDLPHSLDTLAQLLTTGGSAALDKRYVRPDGTAVWANSIVTRLDDPAGAPQRFLVVTIDLSDRKQAETARDQLVSEKAARYEAEQASRMKDEFLSMVSHELQSPLVAILGWTRLLRANPPTRQQLAHQLQIIERNATLQAKLIQDLLDISRILVHKLNLTRQPLELDPVIESAIATLQPKADEKNIAIEFRLPILEFGLGAASNNPKSQIPNPKLTVWGDSERLHQVFTNILTNAVKFTPAWGQIIVTRSLVEVDKQLYAEVSITDTGIGIAADFLPHVFDRFLQAEKSGSAGGLGLGLAIARHLVELHQGTIQAESPGIGQGATFTVRLPLVAED